MASSATPGSKGVTHVGENLLSRLRDGIARARRAEDGRPAEHGRRGARDAPVRSSPTGNDGDNDLRRTDRRCSTVAAAPTPAPSGSRRRGAVASAAGRGAARSADQAVPGRHPHRRRRRRRGRDARPMGLILVDEGRRHPRAGEHRPGRAVARRRPQARPDPRRPRRGATRSWSKTSPGGRPTGRPSLAESTIRVDVDVLDRLMNLVGELVLARNNILQHIGGAGRTGHPGRLPAARPRHRASCRRAS